MFTLDSFYHTGQQKCKYTQALLSLSLLSPNDLLCLKSLKPKQCKYSWVCDSMKGAWPSNYPEIQIMQGHLESTELPQFPAVWHGSVSLLDRVWALKRNLAYLWIYHSGVDGVCSKAENIFPRALCASYSHCSIWTHFLLAGRKQVSLVLFFFLATCVWSSFWNTINTCLHIGRILGCKITNWFQSCLLLVCWCFFHLR